MGIVVNIRGTNGAGKTTLARQFLDTETPVDLNWYPAPTKAMPVRQKRVEGYGSHAGPLTIVTIGPYRTATGGLDNVPSFPIQQAAILYALGHLNADAVIAEGVLASTVYGSWGAFANQVTDLGHQFAFCYLQTPLEVCFERIKQRQEKSGKVKDINTKLVEDKFRSIASTRLKALSEGQLVYDLPFGSEVSAVSDIICNAGDQYIAHA